MKNRIFVLGSLLFFATAAPAMASQITSSADPALAGGTVVDFESQSLGSFSSLTVGGVTFTAGGSTVGYISTAFAGNYNSTGAQNLQNTYTNGFTTITFSFANPTSAFGFNFGASNEDWLLQAFDSGNNLLESYTLPQTWWSNSGDFFGLANNGMSYATLTQLTNVNDPAQDWILLDNFTYKSSAQVPEPSTMLLLGSGLVGFGVYRKKFAGLFRRS